MTEVPITTERSKKQSKNTKTPPRTSITQQSRTDLGRSVKVTTDTKLVLLNRLRDPNLPTNRNCCVMKLTHTFKNVNNPSYQDRAPTANKSGETIKS